MNNFSVSYDFFSIQNCNVTFANVPGAIIHPVRNLASWSDTEACKDNRLDTTVSYANGRAVIDWRSFHFNDPNGVTSSEYFSNIDHLPYAAGL